MFVCVFVIVVCDSLKYTAFSIAVNLYKYCRRCSIPNSFIFACVYGYQAALAYSRFGRTRAIIQCNNIM